VVTGGPPEILPNMVILWQPHQEEVLARVHGLSLICIGLQPANSCLCLRRGGRPCFLKEGWFACVLLCLHACMGVVCAHGCAHGYVRVTVSGCVHKVDRQSCEEASPLSTAPGTFSRSVSSLALLRVALAGCDGGSTVKHEKRWVKETQLHAFLENFLCVCVWYQGLNSGPSP
jgi:hypothetical protein